MIEAREVIVMAVVALVVAPGCVTKATDADAGPAEDTAADAFSPDSVSDVPLDGGSDAPGAETDSTVSDAMGTDTDGSSDGGAVTPCPAYNPANPRHHAYGQATSKTLIETDETWKSDDVYFVFSLFEVIGATLTIEAGTHVCLAEGGGSPPTITVLGAGTKEGRVFANGTAARPIVFDRATEADRYTGFAFSGPSDARFDHVRFNGGGIGGLGVLRFGFSHAHAAVLRDVHIESFFKTGLNLQNPLGLSADSTVFLDSQQPTSTQAIVQTSVLAAKTLTPSTMHIASTIPDATRMIRFLDGDVREDLTLSGTIGAAYLVPSGDLVVRRSDSSTAIPTLTLEAGAKLKFGGGELLVGNLGSGNEGSLAIAGTVANPVVLTSNPDPPAPAARGQWGGITLYVGALGPTTALRNVRIENAGNGGGPNILNCRFSSSSSLDGALKLRPIVIPSSYAGPTLENVDIVRSAGDGLAFTCLSGGCLTTDYTTAIKGSDNAGTLLRPLGCP